MATTTNTELYALKLGDSDANKRWGGSVYSAASGSPVHDLQSALAAVGCFGGKQDGDFGPKTQTALKAFQWHLSKIRYRLTASGQAVPHAGNFSASTGVFDQTTRSALADFVHGRFTCAGPLVQVTFSRLGRFRANQGFTQLLSGASSMVVDKEFARTLSEMNAKAGQEGLYVYINQAFRVSNAPVSGAVVPPAKSSAHLVGRALDLQLGSAGAPSPARAMVDAPRTSAIGRFRDHMISQGCRYGGFLFNDPPHYDRQIVPWTGDEYKFRFYFAQRQYGAGAGTAATRVPAL